MKVGDVVVVLVEHPLGVEPHKTKGKCGIITDVAYDGTIALNDDFLYMKNELRPATETEKREFITALGKSYLNNLIDLKEEN